MKLGACVPNVHLFSHMIEMRNRVVMTEASTESFETHCALIRAAFCPGTRSQGKQIFANIFGYYFGQPKHQCKRKVRLREKGTDVREDCWIETKKGPFKIVGIVKVGNEKRYRCRKVRTAPFVPEGAEDLPWEKVWVRKYFGVAEATVMLSRSDVVSKAVVVDDRYIVSMPGQAKFG